MNPLYRISQALDDHGATLPVDERAKLYRAWATVCPDPIHAGLFAHKASIFEAAERANLTLGLVTDFEKAPVDRPPSEVLAGLLNLQQSKGWRDTAMARALDIQRQTWSRIKHRHVNLTGRTLALARKLLTTDTHP